MKNLTLAVLSMVFSTADLTGTPLQAQVVELEKLLASDGSQYDHLGFSLAISGDRVIAGSQGGGFVGAAYIFERQADGSWVEAAKLEANDGDALNEFGCSVSISGDWAIVGNYLDGGLVPHAGSANVFERNSDGSWIQAEKLVASDGSSHDNFGFPVCISGNRAFVGAVRDDSLYPDSGSVYVFERGEDGDWIQVAKIKASDPRENHHFGGAISASQERVFVGVPSDDEEGQDAGAVYVFDRQANGAWTQTVKLFASDAIQSGLFGGAVSHSGNQAIVGSLGANSAYLFKSTESGQWTEEARLQGSDAGPGDSFGLSVGISGHRALVGASGHYDEVLGFFSGAAYFFEQKISGEWAEVKKLTGSGETELDLFGAKVALDGDRLAVGAPTDEGIGTLGHYAGSTYLFDAEPLSSEIKEVSLGNAGIQLLEIDAGHQHSGETYLVLGSFGGVSPGVSVSGGVILPLNPDPYFQFTLFHPNTPPLAGSMGVLGGSGHAMASFTVPLHLDPHLGAKLVGLTVHHAFVTLQPGGVVGSVSNALDLTLVP